MHCTMRILLNSVLSENRFDLTAIFISFCFRMLQVLLQSSQQKIGKLLPSRVSENTHTRQIQKGNRKKKHSVYQALMHVIERNGKV